MVQFEDKVQRLKEQMEVYAREDVMIAFSGGVDSSLLVKLAVEAAKDCGRKVYAVLMHTMLHPAKEVEEAKQIAAELGASFLVVQVNELEGADILDNPFDRCYRCKKYLFSKLIEETKEVGVSNVLEGTNEDDLHVYRPGLRAIRELGIRSPLADAGFTKEEVRRLAKSFGISVSNKPSVPCLATRFPYGARLSYDDMRKVEQGEQFIKEKGFYNVRIRVHGRIARLEVDTNEFAKIMEYKDEIVSYLKCLGYDYVTLDLEGFRSGSMDIDVKK